MALQAHTVEQDIWQLVQTLPNKEDIQKLLGSLTSTLREEIDEVWSKIVTTDQKVVHLETQQGLADARMDAME